MNSNRRVAAIVVTYNPDAIQIARLMDSLAGQSSKIIVVDNGSAIELSESLLQRPEVEVIILPSNAGIAAAQNIGIARAHELACDYVILFDQDSTPPANLVNHLASIAEQKKQQGELIAAIGPSFADARLGKTSRFLRTRGLRSRLQTQGTGAVVTVDHLIASGSLIPMAALDLVGGMREDLFIDYVDTEWSLRAEHRHGLLSYGTFEVCLQHELGQIPISILGRNYAIHSPLRHYYLFRNSVWLWRQPWVPLNWKLARAPRLVLRLGFCLVFARPVLDQWCMIGLGLWHGVTGRMGKHAES